MAAGGSSGRAAPRRSWPRRFLSAALLRRRLGAGILAGVAAFLAPIGEHAASTRLLFAWDFGGLVYLALTGYAMLRSDVGRIRRRAAAEDEAEWVILLLTVAATLVSLVAIGVELHGVHDAPPAEQGLRVGLAAFTILVSWFVLHTIMTLHYAHAFYAPVDGEGLEFPDRIAEPDYLDFLYFAFTIGAASQTADVAIASRRIRHVVLGHTILSFFFNTTVLALAINVGASLI